MKDLLPTILSDSYKQSHYQMYPKGLTKLYSNFTARKSRMPGVNSVIFFGLQYFLYEYLIVQFSHNFFLRPKEEVIKEHKRIVAPFSAGEIVTEQWEKLHDLGYLPLHIKAVPEGTSVPIGVPMLTITNTHPEFAWLVNFIETMLSTTLWQPITSATIANEFKKLSIKHARLTGGDESFADWQNHDFSMRGMSSIESACLSGAGHLTSCKGSDTIPALSFLEKYYFAEGLIAGSVPATEHSVMSCGGKEDEIETFSRLMDTFPNGILSIVSDTWDLWKVLTEYLPALKDKVMARDGKIVVRPDSGDPVDIICGAAIKGNLNYDGTGRAYPDDTKNGWSKVYENEGSYFKIVGGQYNKQWDKIEVTPNVQGVIELLWDAFGGTINEKGYKVLDPHVGALYGDSITLERAEQIFKRLEAKGFCSTSIVFGIGSFTYQYNTRDTFGMAMKATYCEIDGVGKTIFKDPITDSGEKKSAKGLLLVQENGYVPPTLELIQEVSWELEAQGELKTVFKDGVVTPTNLETIRTIIKNNL